MRFTIIALLLAPFMALAAPADSGAAVPQDRPEEKCERDAREHFHRFENGCDGM
jgi:hypothetical protein